MNVSTKLISLQTNAEATSASLGENPSLDTGFSLATEGKAPEEPGYGPFHCLAHRES